MSNLEFLAKERADSTASLSNTNWSFTYSGATGSISFSGDETAVITWPNGQQINAIWAESNGSFWMNVPAWGTTYLTLFVGTFTGNEGSGTLVSSAPGTSNGYPYAFTMVKKG